MKFIEKGKSIIEALSNYTVVDVETTGLDLDYCEIIEIAALKVVNHEVVDTFNSLIKPADNKHVSNFITELTGITNEMLENAPLVKDVIPKFKAFMGDSVLVGHNVNFDVRFIYKAYTAVLGEPFKNNFSDTLRYSRKLFPDLSHHRLEDIANKLKVPYENAHRASEDCKITYACYEKMLEKILKKYASFDDFKKLFNSGISVKSITATTNVFDEEHPLYNKTVVFTGSLSMPRKAAMQRVVDVGGMVSNNVTKKTNFLVIGTYGDFTINVPKFEKSTKVQKAESLKLEGYDINVITEKTFIDMLSEK